MVNFMSVVVVLMMSVCLKICRLVQMGTFSARSVFGDRVRQL